MKNSIFFVFIIPWEKFSATNTNHFSFFPTHNFVLFVLEWPEGCETLAEQTFLNIDGGYDSLLNAR